MMTVYDVHPVNPQKRLLDAAARVLTHDGGIAIYPTDTVYGLGACVTNPKGLDKIAKIIERNKEHTFSFICSDFSQISKYVRMSNAQYRLMKRYLPGPYTFILNATNLVPKKIVPKRKTVGIRMPNIAATLELVKTIGEPLANTSVSISENHFGDPEEIISAMQHKVDIMLNVGALNVAEVSTVVDLTTDDPILVRPGKGAWQNESRDAL